MACIDLDLISEMKADMMGSEPVFILLLCSWQSRENINVIHLLSGHRGEAGYRFITETEKNRDNSDYDSLISFSLAVVH